jgi:hypothetical protein
MWCKKRALNRAFYEHQILAKLDGGDPLKTGLERKIRQHVNSIGTAMR